MARVAYAVEPLEFADEKKSGWYLMRITVADDRGTGIGNGTVVERKPIAKIDDLMEARLLQDAIKSKTLRLLPRDWKLTDVEKLTA